jgi:hypothetical protein
MRLASGNVQFQFAPGSPKFHFDNNDFLVSPLGILWENMPFFFLFFLLFSYPIVQHPESPSFILTYSPSSPSSLPPLSLLSLPFTPGKRNFNFFIYKNYFINFFLMPKIFSNTRRDSQTG